MPALRHVVLVALIVAGCAPSRGAGSHVPSPRWEEQVIYFVMTDRFANGDTSNDDQGAGEFDPTTTAKYSGGDLQGVIDRLDYIQGLGATAVWITPPVANMWWDPLQQFGGYHGYWARHLKKVDEHLGDVETYRRLSTELHRRGMYLIQDIVPNHMGNYFTWTPGYPAACAPQSTAASCATGPAISGCDVTVGYLRNTMATPTAAPEQAPFDRNDPTDAAQRAQGIYHWTPAISDYTSACQEASFQISDLDDLDTENPEVRRALRDSYGMWIKEVGVDAFRVDTAKFAPHDFWNDFMWSKDGAAPGMMEVAKITGRDGFLAFGEVFESPEPLQAGDALEQKVVSYLGTPAKPELNSVLGFPLYTDLDRVFAGGGATRSFTYRLGRLMDSQVYPNPHIIPNFIDNHDVRRFLSVSSPTGEDLLQVLSVLFTVPGIPVVYYGTEQGFTEPRPAMFKEGWGSGDADHYGTEGALYLRIAKLAGLRKASPALMRGRVEPLFDLAAGAGALAYRRVEGAESVLVLLNTSTRPALVAAMESGLPPGATLEVLHSEGSPPAITVGEQGRVTAVLPAKAVLIARNTGAATTPPAPGATITVTTPIAGQTFTTDVAVSGTVSPATTALRMVIDGSTGDAVPVTVASDGTWTATLPVSSFATGTYQHDVAFFAPGVNVSTPQLRFTTSVAFMGQTYEFADPAGDDRGPGGTYSYPLDATFRREMDIRNLKVEVGTTTLRLNFQMTDFSRVWNPANGFDHVYFNIYFELPGRPGGATVMPMLQATVPAGFSWHFTQFTGGFNNTMTTSAGATADAYGPPSVAPGIQTDLTSKTITFVYDRNSFGLATWSGVKIYATTWDFDGIGAKFRALCTVGSQWEMGGGMAPPGAAPCDGPGLRSSGPMIMDDVGPVTIP